jgi:hypothetical protein
MTKREEKRANAEAQGTLQIESKVKLNYSHKIEARRSDYERLAQSLITMMTLEHERVHPTLDVDLSGTVFAPEEGDKHLLMDALQRHILLAFESVEWYSPEAMKLYVEMRLLADEQSAQRAARTGA